MAGKWVKQNAGMGRVIFQAAHRGLLALLVALPGFLSATAWAAEPPLRVEPGPQRPRIGLVLSGGGARGLAHVGVLKVLEQLQIFQ